ncbi:MAG: NADP-dependent oxidoreductase [Patescibacteria group bacterium]|nr:NADP-dependent oxidoreductase [Patescibacteria group bacterium]MDE2588972.1 NADP-dependent oxidoreductase [Patescibacteria group bacterium]
MKAAQISSYGDPSVIMLNENAPEPTVKPGQLLVENYAASINVFDWKLRSGFMQKMIPLQFPFTLGGDYSGKVIQVGDGVTNFKVGDEVYGQAIILSGGSGSMAEVVAANAVNSALRPTSIHFLEAGALPLVGVSAIQALEEHIGLHEGQKILIHGGAGGIGHLAVQIAKSLGAYVAATAKTQDIEFVKNLGADEVIDYKTQKFDEVLKDFDAVYDTVGGETTTASFAVLKKGGVLVSMLGKPDPALAEKYAVTAIGQQTKIDTARLEKLSQLIDSGKVSVHVDKVFPLEKVQEAFIYQEQTHPNGKVVLQIR